MLKKSLHVMKGRHDKYRELKVKNEFQDLESATTTMQRFIPDLKKLKVIRPFPHTTLARGLRLSAEMNRL